MKKFLTLLFVLLFVSGEAFATVEVRFNNAGSRKSVAYGASAPKFAHNFGSNAAFTPEYGRSAGAKSRQIQREKALTQAIASNAASAGALSRFDKNYTITKTKSTYTRGGVTYYN